MKASRFSDAQRAFILKQGADGSRWQILPQGRISHSRVVGFRTVFGVSRRETRAARAAGSAGDARSPG